MLVDVASRMRAEFVEALPGPAVYLDRFGRPLVVNDRVRTLFAGRTRLREWMDLLHPEDRPRIARGWAAALRAERPYEDVARLLLPDGRQLWVRGHLAPHHDAAGNLLGWVAQPFDITAEVEATDQLRRSEGMLADAERMAHLGSWRSGPGDPGVVWSAEVYRILGMEPGVPVAHSDFHARTHPGDRAALVAVFGAHTPGRRELVHRVVRDDGEVRWVRTVGDGRFDAHGGFRQTGTVQDVTEQHRAEVAREAAATALRTLSRGTQVLVRATDEAGLLRDMCDAVVAAGSYVFVWFGALGDDGVLTPVAWSGRCPELLDGIRVTVLDEPEGQGAVGRAVRSGRPVTVADIPHDPSFDCWRARVEETGLQACLALPVEVGGVAHGCLAVYADQAHAFDDAAVRLLADLAADLGYGLGRLRDADRLARALEGTVAAMAATVEVRDPYTAGHQRRVADLAVAVAHHLGMDSDDVHGVRLAGVVHDIGKIAIPAEILTRPGRLTPLEMEIVQEHSALGADIVARAELPWPVARMVREHHERLDGSGYPDHLSGDDILLGSRIIAVADVVEAMTHHRPYRVGLGLEAALREVRAGRATRYDPAVVDSCLALFGSGWQFAPDAP